MCEHVGQLCNDAMHKVSDRIAAVKGPTKEIAQQPSLRCRCDAAAQHHDANIPLDFAQTSC